MKRILALLALIPALAAGPVYGAAPTGYYEIGSSGDVYPFGVAAARGGAEGLGLSTNIVGGAVTADGGGYWLLARDGSIYPFGDARSLGSPASQGLSSPAAGIAATFGGYWVAAADGSVYPYGSAQSYGSAAGSGISTSIVGITASYSGQGYWEVGADGSVYPFGDAQDFGSMAASGLSAPVEGLARTADGQGYWEVARDGSVYPFGDAVSYGDVVGDGLATTIVGLTPTADGKGYWEVGADGAVYPYGDAVGLGSTLAGGLDVRATALLASPGLSVLAANLVAGWNLLELPTTASFTAASMITSIQSQNSALQLKAVATYATARFRIYVPSYASDFPLAQGQGFFVLSSGSGQWVAPGILPRSHVTQSLTPGWNLIGVPSPQTITGQALCSAIPAAIGCQEVASYQGGQYVTFLPPSSGSVSLNAYQGTFVEVQHGGTW